MPARAGERACLSEHLLTAYVFVPQRLGTVGSESFLALASLVPNAAISAAGLARSRRSS